jgi:Heterokaryon incompatibility protein (HET)
MRNIYREAERVLVWLGEKREDSDLAFDMIHKLATDVKVSDEEPLWSLFDLSLEATVSSKKENAKLATVPKITEIPDETMDPLRVIFSWRSWWTRIWVIQEVVSAREALIICGEKSLSWVLLENRLDPEEQTVLVRYALPKVRAQLASTLYTAILFAAVRKQYHGSPSRDSMLKRDIIEYGLEQNHGSPSRDSRLKSEIYKHGLCSLLVLFESNVCADPRDRIYALQNIIGTNDRA